MGLGVQCGRVGGAVWAGRRCSVGGQEVQCGRAGGAVWAGRRCSVGGQEVQCGRAGGAVWAGRRCRGPSGVGALVFKIHIYDHSAADYSSLQRSYV